MINEMPENNKLRETKDWLEDEFSQGAADPPDLKKMSPLTRRKFLALMGVSAAFATTACNNYRDKGKIIPYNKRPEEVIPGKANYYASSCNLCPSGCGIIIKTREGRPIKIDGNPDHPINNGKICSMAHAHILDLYDPDRLKNPKRMANGSFLNETWENIDKLLLPVFDSTNQTGKTIAIFTHTIISPTRNKILDDFVAKYPNTRIYQYEPFSESNRQAAIPDNVPFPLINWEEANIIVALESDFLGREGNHIENVQRFSRRKDVSRADNFNKLYAIEADMSLTGATSDVRMRLKPEYQLEFINLIINEVKNAVNIDRTFKNVNDKFTDFAQKHNLEITKINLLINDLLINRGKSMVHAGNALPAPVHSAVNYLNYILGNNSLYNKDSGRKIYRNLATTADLDTLAGIMFAGKCEAVININTNPIYELPHDYNFLNAFLKVPFVVTFTDMENETSEKSGYVLPTNHICEAWGDCSVRTGIYNLQQPVIEPIFDTRQPESVILNWLSGKPADYNSDIYLNYLRDNWNKSMLTLNSGGSNDLWTEALRSGVFITNETAPAIPDISANYDNKPYQVNTGTFTILIKPGYNIGDGRYVNNGWLHELPHPISKVVWDNYAAISPATSKSMGINDYDLIEIDINGRKLTIAAIIQPGLADNFISVESGYGRTNAGKIGSQTGFNANLLMSKNDGMSQWLYTGAKITKKSGTYKIASSQEKGPIEDPFRRDKHLERKIIIEGTVNGYTNKSFRIEREEKQRPENLVTPYKYPGLKWGMAIDMNKCNGCNECTIACNVENNIPIVGKGEMLRERKIHWFRVDRYYSGPLENPTVNLMPMLCQHCDNAPCESVCPVAATTHSPDGLNQMVYNRCVGTRYCSNNCPYKVRRFNYFDFRDELADGFYKSDSFKLVHNPEVTVRSRGVMEKCTFCIQRIMEARQKAIENGVELKGSDVKTACQEACPSNAIYFGDLHDPNSDVNKFTKHELGYRVLEEFNFIPNITYIAKLRNI